MFAWWSQLGLLEQVLYIIAIPSTLILIIQTVLLLFGLGHDGDADLDHDLDHDFDANLGHDAPLDVHDGGACDVDHDFEHDVHDGPAVEHDPGLRLFTLRGIVAFLAIFAWVAIALLDLHVTIFIAFPVALLAGFAAMSLVAVVILFSLRMQQSGNLELNNAIGKIAEVYVPMEKEGKGKVTLVVQERFMELDAVCMEEDLKTGQQVRVVGVTPANVLVVTPLTEESV